MGFRPISTPDDASKPGFRPIGSSKPSLVEDITGAFATINRAIPLADEAADAAGAFIDTASDILTGREVLKPKIGERVGQDAFRRRYQERRARSKAASDEYVDRRPIAGNLAKGVGLAVQAVPAAFTGGVSAAPAAARTGGGLLGATWRAARPVAEASLKSAVAAGLGAQVSGLTGEGTVQERIDDANRATVPAMAVGAALPVAIAGVGAARRGVTRIGQKTGETTARIANRATGGAVLDAETEAAKRMAQALKADGLGPREIRLALEEWQATGASSPTLMDLAGENTRALLRAAASKPGAGRNKAVEYAGRVASDLQDNAISRTSALTPDDPVSATALADELAERQSALASEQYAPAYATPVQLSADVVDPLMGEPGRAALRRARQAAVARGDYRQIEQLDGLLRSMPEVGPPDLRAPVDAGTLDRVRIAMSGRGAKAQQSPDTRDIASGLFRRAGQLDEALEAVPELRPARETYRAMQAARDAVELGGSQPFTRPDVYADELDTLVSRATPEGNPVPVSEDEILRGAQVGLRSELERQIGAPAEGSTGVLNRIATGTNPRRVLEETYGLEDASLYRDALSREIDRLQNARFISPNTGSQSAPRLMDETLVELPDIPTGPIGLIRLALDKIRRGATLTDAEREALISLGTRQIEPGRSVPDIPELRVPERLLTPAQRQRLAHVLAVAEGSQRATAER